MSQTPFDTVLVANRGEISRRVIRTLRAHGVRSVAVHSDGDADAPHVREADVAVRLGPDPAATSYLAVDAVIAAARRTGAQAIHPGYGFLSESVELARACAENGIVFVGPGIPALEVMGDKGRAREKVQSDGVPVVPGFTATGLTDAQVIARADEIGYPMLVKPSAGGGGKGMEIVHDAAELPQALASARRIATAAFGDDALVLERLIRRPRHIEVQIFGDTHGTVVALGERECTLQRRHQKVIEEAPSPLLDDGTRRRLFDAAVRAARSVDYVGAGTVEFLVDADAPTEFFFIEMNTRLQVEHPVTEAVTGLDLVAMQLAVAAGEALPPVPPVRGHAVEARVYAESPEHGFLPSIGTVLRFQAPADARTDAAVETGSAVSGFYDPMIAKVIVHAPDRAAALARLDAALGRTVVLGVETNIAFLRTLCTDARVVAGDLDTGLIESLLPLTPVPPTVSMTAAAAAVCAAAERSPRGASALWRDLPGWRLDGESARRPSVSFLTDDDLIVSAPETDAGAPSSTSSALGADGAVWVAEEGRTVRLRPIDRRERMRRRLSEGSRPASAHDPECRAPMPGGVVAVHVVDGATVRAGEPLVSIEAMKMEHPVPAPHDGTVRLLVAQGDQVRRDQSVARVTTEEPDDR